MYRWLGVTMWYVGTRPRDRKIGMRSGSGSLQRSKRKEYNDVFVHKRIAEGASERGKKETVLPIANVNKDIYVPE